MPLPLVFEVRRYDDPDVARLVEEVQQEYVVRYGGPDADPVDPAQFDPPEGLFLLALLDGRPVAMGGWRRLPPKGADRESRPAGALGADRRSRPAGPRGADRESRPAGPLGADREWPAGGLGADAEIKRMYVTAALRRRGLARAVLAELERTAARAGVRRLVLATGPQQPEAVAMYERDGYTPAPAFGHYAGMSGPLFYSKDLAPGTDQGPAAVAGP